ncbi:MAG: hypothetical protein N3B11_07995, partial [Coriobacteriia bacterium]|nr:hypothetical protein [Coriobacteriia bacterium]
IVPKDGHALVGSVFYPGARHPHARHDAFLTDLRERFRAFGESVSREAAAASCIRSISDLVPGRGRVLLAGEAGGFLSPTSGEGISYALGTGELAGAAATNDPDHALLAYERSLRTLKTQVRAKLAVLPLLESTAGRTMGRRLPSPIISAVTRHL